MSAQLVRVIAGNKYEHKGGHSIDLYHRFKMKMFCKKSLYNYKQKHFLL